MFKLRGNRFMKSESYAKAINLYTFAIALCKRNAVYYCNRAAAYTQVHRYDEAIQDCLKSIEINPNYVKAYSRLGIAYYARGDCRDALDKGFRKALQLDPNSDSDRRNIWVAEHKLLEECQQAGKNMGSNQGQASTQPSSTPGFDNMLNAAQAAGSISSTTTFPSFPFSASTPGFDMFNAGSTSSPKLPLPASSPVPSISSEGSSAFSEWYGPKTGASSSASAAEADKVVIPSPEISQGELLGDSSNPHAATSTSTGGGTHFPSTQEIEKELSGA